MARPAAWPPNERERVARLHALDVLDTASEPLFDALARAAMTAVAVPIALISLIDTQRQWFKSNLGMQEVAQTPRDLAFCAHAILSDALMEVPDALADPRFADNPLVTGAPGIRFYAGAPIVLADGLRMGTLCVIDRQPRVLSDMQRQVLQQLARAVAQALQQRVLAQERDAALQREAEAGQRLAHILQATGAGTAEWNTASGELRCNANWASISGRALTELASPSPQPWFADLHPDDLPRMQALLEQHQRGELPVVDVETRIRHRDGHWRWVRDRLRVTTRGDDREPAWIHGVRVDIDATKQAQLALAASEARARALYESTPAMMHSINPQGRLLSVSDQWLRRLGYRREQVIGRPLTDFLSEASAELARIVVPELFRSGRCERVPYQMLRSDGSMIDVELSATIEYDDFGAPVRSMAIIEDVTARHLAERRLIASEAFLERTGQLAGVGGWEVDLDTNEVYWSDETCRLHEVPPGFRPTVEEAISFYAPEAREVIGAAVKKGIDDGTDWDLELPLVTATGRRFWGRAVGSVQFEGGRPRKLVGAFQDVTFRRRAIASLEASDRRFRKLFQYSLGLICTHDLDGVLLSVNPAAARSLGYAVAELMGRRLDEFMRPEYRERFRGYLDRVRDKGSDSGLLHLIAPDGGMRIWQYHNVLDDEGDEPYVLGHAQDITEREQQVQQLRDWSVRDPLTGCFNRRFLNELADSMGDDEVWGCIAVDLDRFKQVNDTHGHQRGDEVLVAMGRFLQRHVRPADVVVRVGGDEFLVLLKQADERLTAEVVQRLDSERQQAPIAFTLGEAVRQSGSTLDSALAAADKRLYEARAGRDLRQG